MFYVVRKKDHYKMNVSTRNYNDTNQKNVAGQREGGRERENGESCLKSD